MNRTDLLRAAGSLFFLIVIASSACLMLSTISWALGVGVAAVLLSVPAVLGGLLGGLVLATKLSEVAINRMYEYTSWQDQHIARMRSLLPAELDLNSLNAAKKSAMFEIVDQARAAVTRYEAEAIAMDAKLERTEMLMRISQGIARRINTIWSVITAIRSPMAVGRMLSLLLPSEAADLIVADVAKDVRELESEGIHTIQIQIEVVRLVGGSIVGHYWQFLRSWILTIVRIRRR